MDQCGIDLTDVPEAQIETGHHIHGTAAENTLDIDAVSRLAGTNKKRNRGPAHQTAPQDLCEGNDSGTGYSSAERMTP